MLIELKRYKVILTELLDGRFLVENKQQNIQFIIDELSELNQAIEEMQGSA